MAISRSKPFRKNRKRIRRAKLYRKPKSFSPGIFSFKRSTTEVVDLIAGTGQGWTVSTATGNQGIGKTFQFALNDVNDPSDFVNLFKYYKIKAVRVQVYLSNTITAQDEPSRFPNSNLMMYTDINNNGVITGSDTVENYLDSQTSKRRTLISSGRRPIDLLMRMKIANTVYGGTTNTDYTLSSPKWISTDEPNTPHYGMNMFIGRVDGEGLTTGYTNAQYARFVYTYYIQCKKVR